MRIISERGTNLHIFPMENNKGKIYDDDYAVDRNGKTEFIGHKDSRWDYNCYRVMDFVSSIIREQFDEWCFKKFGKRNVNVNDLNLPLLTRPDLITDIYRSDITDIMVPMRNLYSYGCKTSFSQIVNHPCLKGLQPYAIKEAIKKINNFKFKTNYKIKSISDSKKSNGNPKFNFLNGFSNFDESFYKFIKIKEIDYNLGLNGKKYNQKILFQLGPNFGCSKFSVGFLHNIFSGGYQVIKNADLFYSLSKYANILYRLKFMQYSGIRTYLKFSIVMKQLGLSTKNITNSKKKFKQIIEELSDNKLIYITEMTEEKKEITYAVSMHEPKKKKIEKVDSDFCFWNPCEKSFEIPDFPEDMKVHPSRIINIADVKKMLRQGGN